MTDTVSREIFVGSKFHSFRSPSIRTKIKHTKRTLWWTYFPA